MKRVLVGGEDAKTVALELDINPRTAQLWVAKARETTSRDVTEGGAEVVQLHGSETAVEGGVPPYGRQDRFQ